MDERDAGLRYDAVRRAHRASGHGGILGDCGDCAEAVRALPELVVVSARLYAIRVRAAVVCTAIRATRASLRRWARELRDCEPEGRRAVIDQMVAAAADLDVCISDLAPTSEERVL